MASPESKQAQGKGQKPKGPSQQEVVEGFQEIRKQQRGIAGKISEFEMEKREHELVIEALKETDPNRRCFRLVGGVLVERTVAEVLPALQGQIEQMNKLVETLTGQLETKGKELNDYREKYNIRVRGEDDKEKETDQSKKPSSGGVLVANSAS